MRASRCLLSLLLAAACLSGGAGGLWAQYADDWPTYRRDAQRSAVTTASLDVVSLELRWTYASPQLLRPAWPGPSPRDQYNSPTVDNVDRLDLDPALHVAAVGDFVYFGSSIEDSLKCLDARDGTTPWVYTTDGPVRFAPHVLDGKVYFGSDDGFVYCVAADGGKLVWQTRIAPSDYSVPSNGKLISLWPNRTGVIVRQGIVYCGAGVFPSEGVVVCALDAETGQHSGPRLFRQRYTDMSLQGYVLASETHLYFPGGRSGPWVFDRATGERQGQFGGGGTYAVITGDDALVTGPGKTSPALEEFHATSGDRLAGFAGARQIVLARERAYISTDSELLALDHTRYVALGLKQREFAAEREKLEKESPEYGELTKAIEDAERQRDACYVWRVPSELSGALIVAGDHVIAGGRDRAAAYATDNGTQVWSQSVEGDVRGLAAARGRLFVSTTAGAIHCFE